MQSGELRAAPAMSHVWDFQIVGFSIRGFASGKQQATQWLNLMAQVVLGSNPTTNENLPLFLTNYF
jgi:hypothetical protein